MHFRTQAHRFISVMLTLFAALTVFSDDGVTVVRDYEVTTVRGKLQREVPEPGERLQVGDIEHSGALLRTGWRSAAELRERTRGATFALDSRTRVRLAGDRPGVLLELEKGRLRAIFETISAEQPAERIVTTPSAVLTVRGTDYAVEVDGSGNTTVVVFEGEVEVVDIDRLGPPVKVRAQTSCYIPRGRPPGQVNSHSMSSGGWNHGRMPATLSAGSGSAGTPGAHHGGAQHRTGGAGQRHGGGGQPR